MPSPDIEMIRCALDDARVAPLLDALEQQYEELYGASSEMARTTTDDFAAPTGAFVIAMIGGRTVAGGGVRRHGDAVAEIKRVWTDASSRRRGLASLVLDALESDARMLGYERIVLETGPLQPEAAALYAARGYRSIPPFGPYPDDLGFALDL